MDDPTGQLSAVDYDPFADTAPLQRVVPTTEAQREIWLACQLGTDASVSYNLTLTLALHGRLDRDALRRALHRLAELHDALRCTVGRDGEQLFIGAQARLELAEHDLGDLDPATRDAELQRRLRVEADQPFDLENGPLARALLLDTGADDAVLALSLHHIVCDGWSFDVLVRNLGRLYAQETGTPAEPAQARDFTDLAQALEARAGSAEHAADEAFWLQRYHDTAPVLELPLDHPRPAQRGFASAAVEVALPAARVTALRQLGARRGAGMFSVLLTGWALTLQRLSAAHEVVVGVPAAAQTLPGFEDCVGHAVNLLPLRLAIDPDATLGDNIARVQALMLDAFEHQHYTFGTLLQKLRLQRDPSRVPLAPVMFNLDQPLQVDGFVDLRVDASWLPRSRDNFELSLNVAVDRDGLRLQCQYASTLFDAASVTRWLHVYGQVLASFDDPELPAAQVDIVPDADRARYAQLNATTQLNAAEPTLHAWLRARTVAHAPVLVCDGRSIDGASLWSDADRIARALRARGVRRGSRVGLSLARDAAMLPALLGVLQSGAAYVPLDPSFPRARLRDMADDAELALVLTRSDVADALDWPRAQSLWLDSDAAEIAAQPATPLPAGPDMDADGESPAYMIYTSGSTGKPKGVVLPHRAVLNFLQAVAQRPGLQPGARLLAVTTLSFDIAVLELMLPLACGGCVVLATREQASDADALLELIESEHIDVLQATPGTWHLLLGAGWQGRRDFRALVGGEALPADLARALLARCDEVWNMYGPTETAVWSTCWRVEPAASRIVIGTPLANNRVWIVDERGQLCPIGVPGEICIGGLGVAAGYWRRPELSAERFVAETFADAPGARMYRTGDRGRWCNDGQLEHLGRLDFQVKLRGFRIELGDIESCALEGGGLAQAVALVREDQPGDARLVLYVVARAGAPAPHDSELRAQLRSRLPAYMLPQHIVALPRLPVLPNGKVDRKQLPPPGLSPLAGAAPAAPASARAQQVAGAMAQVLRLPQLGIDDDFFAVGGHSLLAARLAAGLRQDHGTEVTMAAVFGAPTARALAAWIDAHADRDAAARPRAAASADQTRAPASAQQRGLWFAAQLDSEQPTFNTPSAHRLLGDLDAALLGQALDALVARHPALRTEIVEDDDGMPLQVVVPRLRVELALEDLSTLDAATREAELMRRLQARCGECIDMAQAPLWRAGLYRLAPREHVLFFMPHHLIWDGGSLDIFERELPELYDAALQRRPPQLDALPLSYIDYTAWQHDWQQGTDFAAQLEHWRARLLPLPAPLQLAADRPRPAWMSHRGLMAWTRQDASAMDAIDAAARRYEVTPYMLLLGAFALLLRQQSGQADLLIGTPVRSLPDAAFESAIGFFVNTLVLRLRIEPGQTCRQLVASVGRAARDAFAAPDVPMEAVMRLPGMRRPPGQGQVFQAFFAYQDSRHVDARWGTLQHHAIGVHQNAATEDLLLSLRADADGLSGALIGNADLFDAARIDGWLHDLLANVALICRAPDAPIDAAGATGTVSGDQPVAADAPTVLTEATVELTPSQRLLASVWSELLGTGQVAPRDNFFDLGGHSLLVMQAVNRMRKLTGRKVPARVYMLENLAQIAARYDTEQPARGLSGLLARLRRRDDAR